MDTEQIDRLIERVSDDFRTRWEKRILGGKSLSALQEERLVAKQQQEKCRSWYFFWSCVLITILVVAVITIGSLSTINIKNTLISVVAVVGVGFLPLYKFVKSEKTFFQRRDRILEIENIFERFNRSVQDLNPHGTGNSHHDRVDEEYVMARAVTFAARIIDAELSFDRQRYNKCFSRSTLTSAGAWLDKCRADQDSYTRTLVINFAYEIDWRTTFNHAERHLNKTRPTE